jgi:hypothetical protein
MNVLPPTGLVEWLLSSRNLLSLVGILVGTAIVMMALAQLTRARRNDPSAATGRPLRQKALFDRMAAEWQLFLLGITGFVLSLASGYTTWMGMTNFTGEKTLSLMVTFGIQGVMLIVAWLIGESFATGMNRRLPDGRPAGKLDTFIGVLLALVVVSAVFYWVLHASGTFGFTKSGDTRPIDWSRFADVAAYFALGLIVLGVLAFNFARGGELSLPYVQSARIIVKNAVLWVMFLACMATSVFFSFDSLFTAIFPKEERVRAAQLRAQNQVAGIVADIGSTIETRRVTEIDRLFQVKGWTDYDRHLTTLAERSQGAQREIEAYFNAQIEDKNRAIKQQQERITSAQSGSAGLLVKKNTLTDELSRLKGERPSLAADYAEKKSELDNRAKGVDAKRVEAQAEDRGAEGTLKQGKGPMYRQLMAELARMQDAYKIQETRVRDSQQRLNAADTRIAQVERELAAVDGDIAKLKGEAETAQQRIKLTQESGAADNQPRIDPARVLPAFERARLEFRQEPTREKLVALHQQCSQLFTAMISTPATRDRVRGVDCDPKQATEAAAVMFALNDGMKAFDSGCAGGDKLAAHQTTDALYGFARKCLADSGLPARETDDLRTKINFLELSRDDKAHPFVATINAFQDGNRLAYLALAIAIAMDALIFMSGLFAANAVRSPLSDVPSMKARSGRQLEAIVENALLPDTFDNARSVLNAMRPITAHDGFSARVVIQPGDPHAADIRRVLNAAATIGAVRHVDLRDEIYEVRSELFEFLSVVAKKSFESNEENARLAELRKVVSVSLQPHVGDHADIVLHQCRPISERNGFSAEVYLSRMPADDAFIVSKVLNAGATLGYVQLDERPDQDQRYYVHKQLYKTLLLISSMAHRSGQRSRAPQLAAPEQPGVAHGGSLNAEFPALPSQSATVPAIAAPPVGLSNAPLQTDDEIKREYWDRLVSALEVDPGEASERLNVPGLTASASAAWKALVEHGQKNRMLGDLLRRHRAQQDDYLKSEYDLISEEIRGDRRRINLLDEMDVNVRSHLEALMVFPENGLLATIVSGIESAAQTDNGLAPGEQSLKDRLKGLQQDIAGLDLASATNWDQIKLWYEESFSPDQPNILRLAERRHRQ